ncbi:MAG TPA: fumarylacetoacetate hydrolase family protein [Pyrinomonadaceae bacterium]|nr:fumarylacetoacetate hydrolase family protein [Pyrinomonadaceae bacterium]
MKLCRYQIDLTLSLGCLVGQDKILDISGISGGKDLLALIDDGPALERIEKVVNENGIRAEKLIDLHRVSLHPPIGRPGKIVCLAGNYGAHITESGYVEPATRANFTQQLFLKPSSSLLGDGGVIELGQTNHRVGWETELALVIGKGGKNIDAANAYDHVFGYTILNDISERGLNSTIEDRHVREMDGFCDWLAGKWFDGFAPCGPCIVTKDEIPRPHELKIGFYLNGEMRQHGSTLDMIFSIPEQIAYISSIMTLEPGDIISTGTPSGAGLGGAQASLEDGDELVCVIEGIGTLKNTVRWVA